MNSTTPRTQRRRQPPLEVNQSLIEKLNGFVESARKGEQDTDYEYAIRMWRFAIQIVEQLSHWEAEKRVPYYLNRIDFCEKMVKRGKRS
nr:MAG TPA_asm: hypothetical protein [Caudoviricetes sp.]